MPTALVTGGAGFLGSHLCEELLFRGRRVVCVDNLDRGRLTNIDGLLGRDDFCFVQHDVTEAFPMRAFTANAGVEGPPFVDEVYHLACTVSPEYCDRHPLRTLDVVIQGTRNALELAAAHKARFVLASSSEIYGNALVHPQPESYTGNLNPVGPRSPYAEGKRVAETMTAVFARQGLDATIARLFNVYGPRMRPDDGRVVPTFIRQALAGEPLELYGDGSQTRSLCFVTDTARGLVQLADDGDPGPVNIGNPIELTMLQLARLVIEQTGSLSKIVLKEPASASYSEEPARRCPDITRAAQLGWTPMVGLVQGLERTIAAARSLEVARAG